MTQAPRLVKTRPLPSRAARGIVSSRRSGSRIEVYRYAPEPALESLVEMFWQSDWELPPDAPHTTELLSDPCIHLVFEDGKEHPEARIVGVWTKLWKRQLSEKGRVRAVKLRAGGASRVLPMPLEQWTDSITPLSAVFAETEQLMAEVLAPEDPICGLEVLASFLANRQTFDPQADLAQAMVQFIRDHQDVLRVDDLASEFELTVRAVQRIFRERVGASPKWLIRRSRLQEVATRIEAGLAISLSRLATELGYTDQAHLAREFRDAVGKTPSEFQKQSQSR